MPADRARRGLLEPAVEDRISAAFRNERGALGDPAERLAELIRIEEPLLSPEAVRSTAVGLAAELVGIGELEVLLAVDGVTDVLVDGPGPVMVERAGRLERTSVHLDEDSILAIIERLVTPLGLQADRTHPIVDARLPDGTRVAVVLRPVAPNGPILALRRHQLRRVGLERFADAATSAMLRAAVRDRENILVYGPTGAGKTTLVNALVSEVPTGERVILIEDTAELDPSSAGVVRLEARTGNAEGAGRVAMGQLVRAALRLRPDRIVVGEVRGPEAADMVWALSTGHRGSMSTVHADGAADALARLEVMVVMGLGDSVPLSAARQQVTRAMDLLIGVGRSAEGDRCVRDVHRLGLTGLEPATAQRSGIAT